MFADGLQKHIAEILGLARAHAFHLQQRVNRSRPQTGHFAERGIVKNDVRRNASRTGDLESNPAQPIEELAIDVLPRLGFDA